MKTAKTLKIVCPHCGEEPKLRILWASGFTEVEFIRVHCTACEQDLHTPAGLQPLLRQFFGAGEEITRRAIRRTLGL